MFKSLFEWLNSEIPVNAWLLIVIILSLLGSIIVYLRLIAQESKAKKE